jgi:hypothetical protein
MKLLESGKFDHILSWSPDGRSFVVYKPTLLVKEALPLFFETPLKYTSFTRKLHRWGFVKVSTNSFFNPKFRRGDLAGAASLSCQKGIGRDMSSKNAPKIFTVKQNANESRISPNTVQGAPYPRISSPHFETKPSVFLNNVTACQRMPTLVPENASVLTNTSFPLLPNLLDMGHGVHRGDPDIYFRDRAAILSLASRYNAMRNGIGRNSDGRCFGRIYDSAYVSRRRSHVDDLLLYFAKQRARHNSLIRNAWKAFKENEASKL